MQSSRMLEQFYSISCNPMPRSGCSALHEVNPNEIKKEVHRSVQKRYSRGHHQSQSTHVEPEKE